MASQPELAEANIKVSLLHFLRISAVDVDY